MRKHVFLSALAILAAIPVQAQLDLKGRVLEKANLEPVPNALVAVGGSSARTNAKGEFTLNGTLATRPGAPASMQWPLLQGQYLRIPSRWIDQTVRIEVFNGQGSRLENRIASPAGERVDLKPETGGWAGRFLRVSARGEAYRFRLPPASIPPAGQVADLPSAARETGGASAPQALGKAAATVRLDISADLLTAKSLNVRSDSGNLGDIVLDYPPRKVDTGAPPIYGAIRLFDGKTDSAATRAQMDSNWIMWVGPSTAPGSGPTPVKWKILPDPMVPGRWTFSECCAPRPGGATWGYDDIITKTKFKDYQLHVEFNLMGTPSDVNAYSNSGIYQSARYELQIETIPSPWDPNNSHGMASIINEFPPPANYARPQGKWQAYDITFRTDRWNGNTRSEFARTTIWWNGKLIHNNRKIAGSIACCDAGNVRIDSTTQGLKLQNEKGADVRFRNIWIKPLTIKDTLTNIGY